MAWRDSRGSRKRLALYLSSMVLGVAALVAIQGFGDNLTQTLDAEAKTLLGADYSLESDTPFSDSTKVLIDSLGGEQARRLSFSSMASFPTATGTRLATIRAVEPGYPFYGAVGTRPDSAASTYFDGRNALVDGALLTQFGVDVGDSIRIGTYNYRIAGELVKMPRESGIASSFSPRVYIPYTEVDTTLFGAGARAEYEVYFKFADGRDVEALDERLDPFLSRQEVGSDTVEEAVGNWQEGLGNLYRFLSLVGFVALLLGSLGVASAVHVYIRRRIASIAVLRCVGAPGRSTFAIYLTQAAVLGLLGALAGCLVGVGIQAFVPGLLADFLPVRIDFALSWRAIGMGMGIGLGVTLLFALWPLLEVRDVSPLRALRSNVESQGSGWRDPLRLLIAGSIAAGVMGFAMLQAPTWRIGLGYAGGIVAVFGALVLVAWLLMEGVRRFFPSSWSYPWRQGMANLYRPNNQTLVMVLALGLGTFLIVTLLLVQRTLLEQIRVTGGEGRPNLVLFDVQSDQIDGVVETVTANGLPIQERVPIVTMRLAGVNGRSIEALRQDSTADLTWAHRREYRSTYRSNLTESETLVDGEFVSEVDGAPMQSGAAVPISIETEIARNELNVGIGDTLTFDVQGVPVTTYVASMREVDWQRIGTNFFVVFPEGVLEQAPQTFVVLSNAPSSDRSARVQQAVVQKYPNVSAIDLSLVLSTFEELFGKMSYVVRFMALFSILTGLIVLVGAVVVSRMQRVQESVLLKTLGAARTTVLKIMSIEYLFLGVLAAGTGSLLSIAAAWALSAFVFEGPLLLAPWPLIGGLVVVTGLTIGIGLINSRGIYNRPPLDVLRAEV